MRDQAPAKAAPMEDALSVVEADEPMMEDALSPKHGKAEEVTVGRVPG